MKLLIIVVSELSSDFKNRSPGSKGFTYSSGNYIKISAVELKQNLITKTEAYLEIKSVEPGAPPGLQHCHVRKIMTELTILVVVT